MKTPPDFLMNTPRFLTLFLAALFLLLLTKCSEDDDKSNRGSLLVIVKFNGQVVDKAIVVTNPATKEGVTDQFGQVELTDVRHGKYEVYAYYPGFGSGKTLVSLDGPLQDCEIELIAGVMIEPTVNIISPLNGVGFSPEETITFRATVNDNASTHEEITLKWESSLDGDLGEGMIDEQGNTSMSIELSTGVHVVRLIATNKLGISSKDSVTINTLAPPSPVLSGSFEGSVLRLEWQAQTGTDFDRFELFRHPQNSTQPELVTSLGPSMKSYTDQSVPFADSVVYFVRAYNKAGYSSQSNLLTVKGNTIFEYNIVQAELLQGTSRIYFRTQDNHILVFDYKLKTLITDKVMDSEIGYFDLANNGFGNELYVPRADGWLYIYDASNFTLKEEVNVGVPVTCVETDGNGIMYTSVSPSPWWEQPLRVFKRSNLQFLGGTGDFDECRLRLLQSNTEIIEITTTIGPTDMDYYEFADGVPSNHANDFYHGDHPLDADIFKVAPAHHYLVTSSQGSIYSANSSMSYQGSLPVGFDSFTDFEFSSDASVIYGSFGQSRRIATFAFPSLEKTSEYKTAGYPAFIFRVNNQLVVVSSAQPVGNYFGVLEFGFEIVDIE